MGIVNRTARVRTSVLSAVLVALLMWGGPTEADANPTPDTQVQLVDAWPGITFRSIVHIAHAPGVPGYVYLVENRGRILRMPVPRPGVKPPQPEVWFDRAAKTDDGGQGGLLSLAFHPRFKENGRAFITYGEGVEDSHRLVLSELKATAQRASTGERELLSVHKAANRHNAGTLAFDRTGMLMLSVGDGAFMKSFESRPQDPLSLLGKILRIDVNRASPGRAYGIPKDNPYVGQKYIESVRPEVWAYGFRNPWKISVDQQGRVWTAEPGTQGANSREWIHVCVKGRDHGWPAFEGTHQRHEGGARRQRIEPLFEYRRGEREGTAIVGGLLYEGQAVPALRGRYLFGDYQLGEVYSVDVGDGPRPKLQNHRILGKCNGFAGIGRDASGEVYIHSVTVKPAPVLTIRPK